jgi:hydrogenase small subunit
MPGDQECLVDIGCWGPVVQCNITERGAINHMGGCMVAGGACIGCTMPGFPDKFSPFYKAPPGSAVSGGLSRTTGAGIRRLRRMSQSNLNRTPIWDRAGEVPSAFSVESSKPTVVSKLESFFYKRLQYHGTVDLAKRNKDQPQPKTMNYFAGEHEQDLARYTPPDPQRSEGADIEER